MKKIAVLSALVFGLLSSCATTPKQPLVYSQYPPEKEIFPAIYEVMNQELPALRFDDIDFYNDYYIVKDIKVYDGLVERKFDLEISRKGTDLIIKNINNFMYVEKTKTFEPNSAFLFYDMKGKIHDIHERMVAIATDEEKYNSARIKALNDIVYLYVIMQDMTSLAFNDFIKTYLSDLIINIGGGVSDVKEVKNTIDGKEYKYLVTLSLKVDDSSIWTLSERYYFYLYSNNVDLIRLSKASAYKTRGRIFKAEKGIVGDSVTFYVAEQ